MKIEKTAKNLNRFIREELYYKNARTGMYNTISQMAKCGMIKRVLLPAYIGWSPNEGSGIFDPISTISDIEIVYYRLDSTLSIDIDSLKKKFLSTSLPHKNLLLLVNYFGFMDDNYEAICNFAKKYQGWILEDNAHGFLTFYNKKQSLADATFFSLHKLFPFKEGGCVQIINPDLKKIGIIGELGYSEYDPWRYNLDQISVVRIDNYKELDNLCSSYFSDYFFPLKKLKEDGTVPQTFPVILKIGNRNRIYELMNQAGFGVVSLYHTLIDDLRRPEFQDALDLSKSILNLPVHQDVNKKDYRNMLETLKNFCIATQGEII